MSNTVFADKFPQTTEKEAIEPLAIARALVVIEEDVLEQEAPDQAPVIVQAVQLAQATHCELELFHVCHESSVASALRFDETEFRREQEKRLTQQNDRLSALALTVNASGIAVSHETRWDAPQADALLRKIDESKPDIVIKHAGDYRYFFGLLANTDWDLIRQSPAHLWFVSKNKPAGITRIVPAVGANSHADYEATNTDHQVLQLAQAFAGAFNAQSFPVHAYEVPLGFENSGMYTPGLTGVAYSLSRPESAAKTREKIEQKHSEAVEDLAQQYAVPAEKVHLAQGQPSKVIPEAANVLDADVIVMAARNLSRWERALQSVTAEPVLADAPCDVVFVKERPSEAQALEGREGEYANAPQPLQKGLSTSELEKAFMDPQKAFRTPSALAEARHISAPVKQRILEVWEQDIRAHMNEGSESGKPIGSESDLIDEIRSAKRGL